LPTSKFGDVGEDDVSVVALQRFDWAEAIGANAGKRPAIGQMTGA
jgi:hypothetical protein